MSLQNISSDNNQLIRKQKKSWLLGTIFIAISCVTMLICAIGCFASKATALAIFCLGIFIPSLILTIYFICKYKTKTDNDWIIDYVIEKRLTSSVEGFELLKQANVVTDKNFVFSKSIDIKASGWTTTKL